LAEKSVTAEIPAEKFAATVCDATDECLAHFEQLLEPKLRRGKVIT
jgi:hypothetical protein